jgi:hypothetical protein
MDTESFISEAAWAVQDWTSILEYGDKDWEKFKSCLYDWAPTIGISGLPADNDSEVQERLKEAYDEEGQSDGARLVCRPSGCQGDSSRRRMPGAFCSGDRGRQDVRASTKRASMDATPPEVACKRRGSVLPWARRQDVRESEGGAILAGICPTCKGPRTECFREGDWACAHCGEHNTHIDKVCRRERCGRQMLDLSTVAPHVPHPAKSRRVVSVDSNWCRSCLKLKTECYKKLDWCCPECCNHNYSRKQVRQVIICRAHPTWEGTTSSYDYYYYYYY